MSVGLLAHLFGQQSYQSLASRLGEKGFKHIQLAMWKAFDNYDFSKPGLLSPGLADDIKEELAKHDVKISVLASYLHLYQRDEKERELTLQRYKECIRYAKFLGAPMVATETGPPEGEVTKEDWNTLVQSVKEITAEAEKWGVFFALEAAGGHMVDTARKLKDLIDEVPSSNIGVVIDPGNLMTAENFSRQEEVMEEAFELLGDRVIAAHAKDRRMNDKGELEVLPAGQGTMNYERYMELLQAQKPQVPIILEECKPEEMLDSKRYVESFLK
ncbi:sugar phosphate isomerase/epimerase family protein [Alkalicoccus daliensis]|uniref:Sugar phosphate isomerase/epimerase n=1 Tax=Alkalicoccus daliensis TaxID=745820 RepID=A0A1H0EZY6_9BACI|nr:sugar phosphate isomerase/epimerase family protein [Alkalicoccus daliensis]SDN87950.1 Sugar phosphate isomerase/epimerase [Alkalicoccus daliensis]